MLDGVQARHPKQTLPSATRNPYTNPYHTLRHTTMTPATHKVSPSALSLLTRCSCVVLILGINHALGQVELGVAVAAFDDIDSLLLVLAQVAGKHLRDGVDLQRRRGEAGVIARACA